MKTAEEILREYIDFEDLTNDTISLLPLTITDAMQEYAQQFIDKILPTIEEIDKASKEYVRNNSIINQQDYDLATYNFNKGAEFVCNYIELKN